MPDDCVKCHTKGLVIVPVRHAVAPAVLGFSLPDWSGKPSLPDQKGEECRQVLRTLRRGYLYVLQASTKRSAKPSWSCYSVGESGCLIQTNHLDPDPPQTSELVCARHPVDNGRLHCVVIEDPEYCDAAWIAFSEHVWTPGTLERYASAVRGNNSAREARMHHFSPKSAAASPDDSLGGCGSLAMETAFARVAEYTIQRDWVGRVFPDDSKVPATLSQVDGGFFKGELERLVTTSRWHFRTTGSVAGVAGLQSGTVALRGRRSPSAPYVYLMALRDPIGIARDLNAFRNQVAAKVKQYAIEREYEVFASEAIAQVEVGARRIGRNDAEREDFENRFQAAWWSEGVIPLGEPMTEANLQNVVEAKWQKYRSRLLNGGRTLDVFRKKLAAFRGAATALAEKRAPPHVRWMEGCPDLVVALGSFEKRSLFDGMQFQRVIGELAEGMNSTRRGQAWIDRLFGGEVKGDANLLVRALLRNHDDMLLETLEFLTAASRIDKSHSNSDFQIAWKDFVSKAPYFRRFGSIYMQSFLLFNANRNPLRGVSAASRGLVVPASFFEGTLLSLFDFMFRRVGKGLDVISTTYVKTLLVMTTGIAFDHVQVWAEAELRRGLRTAAEVSRLAGNMRTRVLTDAALDMNHWHTLVQNSRIPVAAGNGQRRPTDPALFQRHNDAAEIRIGVVGVFLQMLMIYKSAAGLEDNPNSDDARLFLKLAWAGLVGNLLGVSASALNGINSRTPLFSPLGAPMRLGEALTVPGSLPGPLHSSHWTKYLGHWCDAASSFLSGVTGTVYGYLDFKVGASEIQYGNNVLGILYCARGAVFSTQAAASFINLGYFLTPTVKKVFGRQVAAMAARAHAQGAGTLWVAHGAAEARAGMAVAAASRLTAGRAMLLLLGAEMTVFAIVLSIAIAVAERYSDDALQKWFSRCAFGGMFRFDQEKGVTREKVVTKQDEALKAALKSLGWIKEEQKPPNVDFSEIWRLKQQSGGL